MNNRLLLIKCITLLYRESLLPEKESNSDDLVRNVLEGIKLPELSLSINHEREMLMGLKEMALWMCGEPLETIFDKDDVLGRLKLICANDETLYEVAAQGIEKEMDEASLKRTIVGIRKFINDTFRENEIIVKFDKAYRRLHFEREKIKDIRQFVKEFHTEIEPYQMEATGKDPAVVGSVNLGDNSSLTEVFQEIQDDQVGTTLFRTGWQELNNMLQGGFRRGEMWSIPALPHMYKSGFTMSLFRQFAQYNKPSLINPNKKPLLLRISFEDSLPSNVRFLYQNIWENEHNGEMPDLTKVSVEDMAAYVRAKMEVNGFHAIMMRVNPSDWTYKDIQNQILKLEAEGYEIQVLILDYLPMIPTTGCDQGPMGHDYRDLTRRMRNFCSARDILLITPWQLSTDAKSMVRGGACDFVKAMPGGGYYAGSKQIDQELDGELFIHIEHFNGRAYLTIQRGKHRIPTTIPDKNKYFALPFPESGSIPDDLSKEMIAVRKVGGGPIGSGSSSETPFHMFEE